MKIKVNRNIIWAQIFIDQLAALGVRYACISPGSRSTPLTYVLSKNRKIKSFINIDERSSAFFALGLAKSTGKPVIVVTTSGTSCIKNIIGEDLRKMSLKSFSMPRSTMI